MLTNSILYANGPADEDLKILSNDALERVLNSMWNVKETFERIIVDGEVTTRYSWKLITDDGDIIQPFSGLAANPYINQTFARHVADTHNFQLQAKWDLEASERGITSAPNVPNETATSDELF
jgi:hypothetical protein